MTASQGGFHESIANDLGSGDPVQRSLALQRVLLNEPKKGEKKQ